ncbi:MAG TPA: hypothetical protein VG454_12305 [Gemmatimonadales bacterium]|nr:hypothetical protein [Gemmatimonadales bacterium]
MLYRISAALLLLAAFGHTFGGMLGTARRGAQSGPEADRVFADMKAVHFKWKGADTTWFGFWLGLGLCVTAAWLVPIIALWVIGGLDAMIQQTMPIRVIAWSICASMALTSWLGFKYFGPQPGIGFGLVAVLTAVAIVL